MNACFAKKRQDSRREASSFDSGSTYGGKKLQVMIIAVEKHDRTEAGGLESAKIIHDVCHVRQDQRRGRFSEVPLLDL